MLVCLPTSHVDYLLTTLSQWFVQLFVRVQILELKRKWSPMFYTEKWDLLVDSEEQSPDSSKLRDFHWYRDVKPTPCISLSTHAITKTMFTELSALFVFNSSLISWLPVSIHLHNGIWLSCQFLVMSWLRDNKIIWMSRVSYWKCCYHCVPSKTNSRWYQIVRT